MLDLNALPLPDLFAVLTADSSLRRVLDAAFAEDLGEAGDITSESIIAAGQRAKAVLATRREGVVAGLEVVKQIAEERGFDCGMLLSDGDRVNAGAVLARLEGDLRTLLRTERVMLNILGRLCGIATLTRRYADAISGTKAQICDTRKTTPGLRSLEKYAVRSGGGTLHRIGLFDAALYKDNHLAGIAANDLAAKLSDAIRSVRERHQVRFVQVEVDTLEQLEVLLNMDRGLVDMVLLDNMSNEQLRDAVTRRDAKAPHVLLECSGGVTLERVRSIAATGVDRISVGALTHGATWLDIGMDIE
jgi:nicotinate-nucleotide pyrophosphorylase (carboxylating)